MSPAKRGARDQVGGGSLCDEKRALSSRRRRKSREGGVDAGGSPATQRVALAAFLKGSIKGPFRAP